MLEDSERAAALALIKLIHTYPWLIEVADNGYEPDIAKQILIREAKKLKQEKRKKK